MSMSPNTRASTATARPYSCVNTRAISESVTTGMARSVIDVATERPNLDRKGDDARRLSGPFECGVEIRRIDDRESAEMLFALDVWSVRRQHVIALQTKHRRRARIVQASREDPGAGGFHLI